MDDPERGKGKQIGGNAVMLDREKTIEWFEHDYLPRVGAYRKDCKQGCDACMPMHDGDDYCDIDMLCKILAMLKKQEAIEPRPAIFDIYKYAKLYHCGICNEFIVENQKYCHECGQAVKWE